MICRNRLLEPFRATSESGTLSRWLRNLVSATSYQVCSCDYALCGLSTLDPGSWSLVTVTTLRFSSPGRKCRRALAYSSKHKKLRPFEKVGAFCVCCGTWTRTKITSSRGMCPTIRRSRKIYSIFSRIQRPPQNALRFVVQGYDTSKLTLFQGFLSQRAHMHYFDFLLCKIAAFMNALKSGCGVRGRASNSG